MVVTAYDAGARSGHSVPDGVEERRGDEYDDLITRVDIYHAA